MLSFFPRGVLDEIFNLIESVSEDFPSYSFIRNIVQENDSEKNGSYGALCILSNKAL